MNPIPMNGAFDAPAAKIAAKNLRTRMKALGVDFPLAHAYEGVAAVFGHPTWNVLSAAPPEGLPFSILPDDAIPLSVLFGKTALYRSIIEGLRVPAERAGSRSVLRCVVIGSRPYLGMPPTVDPSVKSTRVTFSSEKPLPISIFDTPLGRRLPTPQHRHRIALFLASIIRIVHPLEATPAILEQLEILVDALYLHHSDGGRKSHPFKRASSSATHGELELAGLPIIGGETWWNAADRAYAGRNLALSRAAQSNAVPRLDHVIPFVRGYVSPLTDSGETLSELLARAISAAYRTYPCFTFSESRFGEEERAGYDRIDYEIDARSSGGSKVASALYMAAFNAAAIEADGAFLDAPDRSLVPPALSADIRSTIVLEKAETVLDALGSPSAARKLIEHGSSENRRCLVLTESMEIASIAHAQSATFAVTACSDARRLDAISDLLGLAPEDGDEIDQAMKNPTYSSDSVPAVSSRRVNRRTERTMGRISLG
ncbi:hypothetical protein [Rhizobium leguminosarum]|uniref:hypothetical protein n=1 Tax=Rhizobium leguminosarum TaxID=384 RepID=UPI002E121455|nr:hypothetical protein U8Q02_43210 [Rhizobium leguminosarum]